MQYTLKNQTLSITVDTLGAELVSVIKDGKERLWQNQTCEWNGHAPVLFPVCGHLSLMHEGINYPISAHGFAKHSQFVLRGQVCDELVFSLQNSEETERVYPFAFCLNVRYKLDGNALCIAYEVKNLSKEKPLFFACGSHEAYALDENVDEYKICFEKEENFVHYHHDAGGYLTGETQDFGRGKEFPLPRDFLQKGATLIFKNVNSQKLCLCKKSGKTLAELTFAGFDNLLLWRNGDAKYICIEPWTNLPDYANAQDMEFAQKQGVLRVEAGESKTLAHKITWF